MIRTVRNYLKERTKTAKVRQAAQSADRKELRDTYLTQFDSDIKILDICWAAGQRYSEWKRWLRNAVKDGSAPDRAFRAHLRTFLARKKKGRLSAAFDVSSGCCFTCDG